MLRLKGAHRALLRTDSFAAVEALLLLGGNIGDVGATFARATELLAREGVHTLARSRDHRTEPWGFSDERHFLNRALLVRTELDAPALLASCLHVESALGRVREPEPGYRSRTIDIDLLFAGGHVLESEVLQLPHPRVHERAFALAPAADLVPDLVHPLLGRSVLDLLNDVLQKH